MSEKWQRESSDGSWSAYNETFSECYHSLKDGALSETIYKHITPAFEHWQPLPSQIHILDICFGLGYNTFATIAFCIQHHFKGLLKIYTPEIDKKIFTKLLDFTYPEMFRESLNICQILETLGQDSRITRYDECLSHNMEFCIELYKGDALEYLQYFESDFFHIIYQDAFSPTKNPTLWSEEYFYKLFSLLKPQGILTTYSQSSPIRQNAIKAGFLVYDYQNPYVRGGSLMSKQTLNLVGLKAITAK
ncbi:MnmC family methyltransferase [Helicobacter sp. MIT 05-5293]|uniref:tRNA (5-methylaminomethyl-2-thiouridine)(34)-methyltransferase MnmD n=1 Tax=Helicobacter sp. MIT 05-5293 TaxID=1548149 RepID=UPI001F5401FF|nr:MnmC family methyltransferase [Helicobacter sp. MIT 05-5293]